jgi:hypothetical protein
MKFAEFKTQAGADLARVLGEVLPAYFARLEADLKTIQPQPGLLGILEREIAERADQMVYRLMSEWMHRTAANAPEICPTCDQALGQVRREVEREAVLKTGKVKLRRSVGRCPGCERWRCPADAAIGIPEIT